MIGKRARPFTRGSRCAPPASPAPAPAQGTPVWWNGRAGSPQAGLQPGYAGLYAYATLTLESLRTWGLRKKKGPGMPGPFASYARNIRLLERSVDRGELGVQVGAEAVDDRDDRERNAGSNQAVFNRGGAGLILHETGKQVLHNSTPCTRGCRNLSLVEPAFSAP